MWNKIKKFLEDRGWYKISKVVRHTGGSIALLFLLAGITNWITGSIMWPLASLSTLLLVLFKELVFDKTKWPVIMKEMLPTIIIVALAMMAWG